MKNQITNLVLLLVLIMSCTPQPKEVIIEGYIKNLPDSSVITIMERERDVSITTGKEYTKDGKFRFTLTPDSLDVLPRSYVISGDSIVSGHTSFYADKGVTKITGDTRFTDTWRITNKTYQQKELNMLNPITDMTLELAVIRAQRDSMYMTLRNKSDSLLKIKINSLNAQMDSIGNSVSLKKYELLKSREQFNDITLEEFEYLVKFGITYGDFLKPYEEEVKAIYNNLNEELKNSITGQQVYSLLYPPKKLTIGDVILDGNLHDTAGVKHSMSEYRGKYVLADIWSSGCGPCVASVPELKEVQEMFKDSLHIVGVSTDTDRAWKKATREHGITWNNLSDGLGTYAGFCANFAVRGVPYYMIINPQGEIIDYWMGYRKDVIKERIREAMAKQ